MKSTIGNYASAGRPEYGGGRKRKSIARDRPKGGLVSLKSSRDNDPSDTHWAASVYNDDDGDTARGKSQPSDWDFV